jgi:HlyD family secretion protein
VQLGTSVTLARDSVGGRSNGDKVVSISPVGTVTSAVVNYTVTVELIESNPAIKPGMTATAAFVVDRGEDVLTAPNKAIKTQSSKKVMTLLVSGKQVPVVV